MSRAKIAVIGAGNVGATTAHYLLNKKLGDIVLIDIAEGLAKGKALDLQQTCPIEGLSNTVTGTTDYSELQDSDLVIMTAGLARKPGMTREDLLFKNTEIVKNAGLQIAKYAPQAIVIVVTNPLDIMAYVMMKATGFDSRRVIGMAGILDTARYITFLADALQISPVDIQAMVLGGHGDAMVPLLDLTKVNGIPLAEFIKDADKLKAIVERTRNGGAEIVGYLKTGSAFYSPAAAAVQMASAILLDQNRILPCSAYLNGEYDLQEVYLGVPVKLNRQGLADIVKLPLNTEDSQALKRSADLVAENIKILNSQ